MIDTNRIVAASQFAGFKNYESVTFSVKYAGATIPTTNFVGPIRASTPLNNSNAVSEVQVQIVGLDSFWRYIPGQSVAAYPTGATEAYQVQTLAYYSGGSLVIDTYIINTTGSVVAPGDVVIPALTINCRGFLYNAPF